MIICNSADKTDCSVMSRDANSTRVTSHRLADTTHGCHQWGGIPGTHGIPFCCLTSCGECGGHGCSHRGVGCCAKDTRGCCDQNVKLPCKLCTRRKSLLLPSEPNPVEVTDHHKHDRGRTVTASTPVSATLQGSWLVALNSWDACAVAAASPPSIVGLNASRDCWRLVARGRDAPDGRVIPSLGRVSDPSPSLPTCSLIAFAHVTKVGGTSVRNWFRRFQLTHGYAFHSAYSNLSCAEFGPPFGIAECLPSNGPLMKLMLETLRSLPHGAAVPPELAFRMLFEFHDTNIVQGQQFRAALPQLRPLARSHSCGLVVTALMRKPASVYVSLQTYLCAKYGIRRNALGQDYAQNPACALSPEDYARRYPNPQLKDLLQYMGFPWGVDGRGGGKRRRGQTRVQAERVQVAWVLRTYDVIGVTERIDEFTWRLCHAAHLPARLCPRQSADVSRQTEAWMCKRALMRPLLNSTSRLASLVLWPPLRTAQELHEMCEAPGKAGLLKRIANSSTMRTVSMEAAAADHELYSAALDSMARWRSSAEALAFLGGGMGSMPPPPDKYRLAVRQPPFSARVEQVGKPCTTISNYDMKVIPRCNHLPRSPHLLMEPLQQQQQPRTYRGNLVLERMPGRGTRAT